MKIKTIIIYSHDGKSRELNFNTNGLNVITGSSSTGKSALSEIVEFCMGRSSFNVPEGVIRDKVSWYGVIYKFPTSEILIAKPAPKLEHASSSAAMVQRGKILTAPDFKDLKVNADDASVVSALSRLAGIPENEIEVAQDQSRTVYSANIKHAFYYLFQKQSIISNKDQLLYRQNEQYQPQTIRDTLPILFGISSNDRYKLEAKLRDARRKLKLHAKLLSDAKDFINDYGTKGVSLIAEARTVGILSNDATLAEDDGVTILLKQALVWKPKAIPTEDGTAISGIETKLRNLRDERQELMRKLSGANNFATNTDGFTNEAGEQIDRLNSIKALPRDADSGEWQWPFCEENLSMASPIANALLQELESLNSELHFVAGDRPKLDAYIAEISEGITNLDQQIHDEEMALSAAISANETISEMGSKNTAAARVVGRISLFLENEKAPNDIHRIEEEYRKLYSKVAALEKDLSKDDREDRIEALLNGISSLTTSHIRSMGAEFDEFPFRFDLKHLTLQVDRPDRPSVPMHRTGGGANHMIYHISTLLALHQYAQQASCPIPQFLFIDQPTQVYFPSEESYNKTGGSVEKTEADADVTAVRKLFQALKKFSDEQCKGFQIIVTEHANLKDQWFQDALVESPWTKPPALVPENWPDIEQLRG